MATPTGAVHVAPPAFVQHPGGIFSVVTPQEFGVEQEMFGVVYESGSCIKPEFVSLIVDSCMETDEKTIDGILWEESGPAFTVYAGAGCTLFANDVDEFQTRATARLEHGEQTMVERHLWESTFPARAVDLTPEDGAVSPIRGIGILERWAGESYSARSIVHAGRELTPFLSRDQLVMDGETVNRSLFVDGAGYTSENGPLVVTEALESPVIELGPLVNDSARDEDHSGTFFWKLTAYNAFGETLPSNEVTATVVAGDRQVIVWTPVAGADGYKLYWTTASGNSIGYLVVDVVGGMVDSTSDSGAVVGSRSIPDENTTYNATATPAEEGEVWMYVTGAIMLRRGKIIMNQAVKPETNDLVALSERSWVPTVDCIVGAIRVTLEF